MRKRGIVVGFYQNAETAEAVLRELRRKGFRHSARLSKAPDGRLHVDNYQFAPLLDGVLGGLLGLTCGLLVHLFPQSPLIAWLATHRPIGVAVLALLGFALGWALTYGLRLGVTNRVLERYQRWLVRDESLLLVETASAQISTALDIIRQAGGEHPITFGFYPECTADSLPESEPQQEPLTADRLIALARDLAASQTVMQRRQRERPLMARLNVGEQVINDVRDHLMEIVRVEQSLLLSAEWLLDNAYIIQGNIEDFRRNLPRSYYEQLPVIATGPQAGLPRVYVLASALVGAVDAHLERDNIHNFLQAYQGITPLTIGELWAFPLMLRLRLIEHIKQLAQQIDRRQCEREQADFWANRLLTAARHEPDQMLVFVAELAREQPAPSAHLADQLVEHLYDEETALTAVRGWLERKLGAALTEAMAHEHRLEAAQQVSFSNAISSLRQLALLDWRDLFESLSRVDAILWTDPAGIYSRMSFATRDVYRHAIEEISRRSPVSEIDVAMTTLVMADRADDPVASHVGYYLVDRGRESLEVQVRCRPRSTVRVRRWVFRHPVWVYLGSLSVVTVLILVEVLKAGRMANTSLPVAILLTLLAVLPASELALQLVNYLITRLLPPRVLPKMSFEQGVPEAFRTLVVVPMMLLTPDSIREEVERLEIRYLANPEENLRFALLSDYADAPQPHMPEDAERLEVAARGIEQLNAKYGPGRFFLFHRERQWSESEDRWMGWERKRGKLEQLNRFLMGEASPEIDSMLRVGDADQLRGVRFVITLDSDTQLPRNTARELIETLAHPLNAPRLTPDGCRTERGYTIIQPRVSTSLPSATASYFSRLFTDPTGADPYARAVSDVYQDLTGEGSYHGKGIYDLPTFHHLLSGRFPPSHLLSHDLIEGAHVRTALASDIELFDLFPRDYMVYANRQHRWIRGDWQIADWLLPTIPTGDGRRVPNPLSTLNRWKILDNLRRSLVPAGSLALLLAAWFLSPAPAIWTLLVLVVLFCPAFLQLVTQLTTRPKADLRAWREMGVSLVRTVVFMALLPHQAILSFDAIGRVLYRRLVSHRLLLEWETAQAAHQRWRNQQSRFLWHMAWIPIGALVVAGSLSLIAQRAGVPAIPFLALWLVSPVLVVWLNTPTRWQAARALSDRDRQMLRQTARQTWRFFEDFVGPQTNWLPPDNYQTALNVEVAPRTSPTNIGLWLLSLLGARDLGYLPLDDTVERAHETLQTLDKLERYEGHLLNWYDIHTCEPLYPRYVSMVDSGNLLGALWAFAQGLEELLAGPVFTSVALWGLADTVALLRHVPTPEGTWEAIPRSLLTPLEMLCADPPETLEALVRRLRSLRAPARELAETLQRRPGTLETQRYWAGQIERQVTVWNTLLDRYLAWVDILAEVPEEGLLALGADAHEWRRQALTTIPSLRTLASDQVPGLSALMAARGRAETRSLSEAARVWLDRLTEAVSRAQWFAGEQLAKAEAVTQDSQALADGMNMRFLYDLERKVFAIGYNVNDRRRDAFYYDMLASEARLGSFVAVARGEAPVDHWFALGRPFAAVYGRRALLSWNGTMFEYLMPVLLTRSFDNSLLDQGCRAAVACQIVYARQRGIPWGISEAAYSALDSRQIFQYRAFGVPGLGLKRGLEDDLVVAPYATALALQVDPAEAVQNLKRLERRTHGGIFGDYGFYESIDYTRQRDPQGDPGVVVQTYMAHHQGMTLLAIDNILNDNILQARFHADPRVRATESLLYERVPVAPALARDYIGKTPLPRLRPSAPAETSARVDTYDTPTPRTHLLSNADYSVMVTNAGGGYSRWKDLEITRWRSDTTRDSWGSFCYLKDLESGEVWSAAYQPTGVTPRRYGVLFTPEKAEFRRRDFGIETIAEIIVSPEDDAEIRRITLVNQTTRARRIELTSYAEIALAAHNTDRAHPAFSKLFVQTDVAPESNALLAWRRPRAATDPTPWAVHVLGVEPGMDSAFQYETDRERFLGRGNTTAMPAALEGDLSNSVGAVLDPVFSLRKRVTLEAGQRLQIAFITGAGDSRAAVEALAVKYCDLRAVNRAMELAWTHAQLALRHLRLQPDEAMRFQNLASYVLYPSAALRPPEDRLRRNLFGQSRLWAHGISGDLPIVVVTVGDPNDLDVVRQILMAHNYWRVHGLKCDLVILNEEAAGYDQPVQDQLQRMAQAYSLRAGMDQPGGVFLRPAAQVPEEDLTLILTVARVVLVAARGLLVQQLARTASVRPLPPLLPKSGSRPPEEPSAPLPFMELPYFNGLGGFTPDGSEYAIYLGPEDETPAPWINVMANPQFGAIVSESGAGFCWYGNSQSNRLTPWSNDPVTDPPGDALYIRDEDLGVFWTPTAEPIRELDAYRARHGQGYSVFEHNSHAIEQELVTFVPMDDQGGAPLRIQRLRLRNGSSHRRRLTVTAYAEWVLGVEREDMQMHVTTNWDAQSQALFARNAYHPDFGGRVAFAACSPTATSYTGDRTEFVGRNGALAAPAALARIRLSNRVGAGLDPCAALQATVELEPGRQIEVIFLIGQGADTEEARALIQRYRDPANVAQALQTTKAWWDRLLGTLQVETPDLGVNFLLNRWLLYQDLSCRIWGRSAFYQSGGAFGFRDQMQDAMALVYADPQVTREQILRSAARQFLEGDVQHWWHPPSGAGVRTRISDDLLWLPFVTAHYVRTTGDRSILDAMVPFIEGKTLEPQEVEAFYVPAVSTQEGSLLEHCRRAIAKGLTSGPHGLPLIGTGDWNDGLNRVGVGGKGESVWLAWFLIHVLHDFAELLLLHGDAEEAKAYEAKVAPLVKAVEEQAWDGAWYRRAYFDDGTPLGSAQSEEAKIDSLAQSWGVISGAADPERATSSLQAVEKHLVRLSEQLVLLFTPPFDKTEHDPGYIKGYLPGVRENGGQYTHGSLWVPLAFARRGEGEKAVQLLRLMSPVEHTRIPDTVARYRVEPYVVAADIYALQAQEGRGGWTWYTGSAGWMYRVWIEEVLGLKLRGETLRVDPAIPSDWDGFTLRYRYRRTEYAITVENPGHISHGVEAIELDGKRLPDGTISLRDDGVSRTVRVVMGLTPRSPQQE